MSQVKLERLKNLCETGLSYLGASFGDSMMDNTVFNLLKLKDYNGCYLVKNKSLGDDISAIKDQNLMLYVENKKALYYFDVNTKQKKRIIQDNENSENYLRIYNKLVNVNIPKLNPDQDDLVAIKNLTGRVHYATDFSTNLERDWSLITVKLEELISFINSNNIDKLNKFKYDEFSQKIQTSIENTEIFSPLHKILIDIEDLCKNNELIDENENIEEIPLENELDSKETVNKLLTICNNYRNHLGGENIVNAFQKNVKANEAGYLWRQKYCCVSQLIRDLSSKNLSSQEKLADFFSHFNEHKDFLSKHRDHGFVRLMAAILHVLTLGICSKVSKNRFAFWRSDGEALSLEIEDIQLKLKLD